MPVSPESQALRGCTTLLRTGVDPGNIISSLYDSDLLTPEERDQANAPNLIPTQRMDVVCSALERRVRVRLEAFHKFVKILLSEPALEPVAKDLYDLYLEKGGTRQEYAAQFEAPVQPTPAPVQPTPGIVRSASIASYLACYTPTHLQCYTPTVQYSVSCMNFASPWIWRAN